MNDQPRTRLDLNYVCAVIEEAGPGGEVSVSLAAQLVAELRVVRAELGAYARLLLRRPQDVPAADVAWKLRQIIGEAGHD